MPVLPQFFAHRYRFAKDTRPVRIASDRGSGSAAIAHSIVARLTNVF